MLTYIFRTFVIEILKLNVFLTDLINDNSSQIMKLNDTVFTGKLVETTYVKIVIASTIHVYISSVYSEKVKAVMK